MSSVKERGRDFMARLGRYLMWMAAIAPAGIAARYIYLIATNVPFYDEWQMLDDVEAWREHRSTFFDVLSPYGGYVMGLQKASAFVSARWFHWDIRFEIAMGFLMLVLLTCLTLFSFQRKTGAMSFDTVLCYALPVVGTLFSLRQYENLTGPWGVNSFGTAFFALLAFYLLVEGRGRSSLAFAVASAIVSSISFTNGLLVWPIGLILLIVTSRWRLSLTWMVSGACFLSVFFRYLYPNRGIPAWDLDWRIAASRFFGLLGSITSLDKGIITVGSNGSIGTVQDFDMAVLAGFSIVVLVGVTLWQLRAELEEFAFPLGGIFYGIGSAGMIAIGRANLGVSQAFGSRYTSVSIIVVVFTLYIIAQRRLAGGGKTMVEGGLVALLLFSYVFSTIVESDMLRYRVAFLHHWSDMVLTYKTGGDLANPHFSKDEMLVFVKKIDEMGLSVFYLRQGFKDAE